ncbi:hypothetical protein ABZ215_24645 [Amycolatopsis sp. NPDC006131]|uniref:hypothetical protein n=1 Tax=Amycolatopsis sp. NPDC006131 TaxID=3156731 RepID=UPI0033AC2CAE
MREVMPGRPDPDRQPYDDTCPKFNTDDSRARAQADLREYIRSTRDEFAEAARRVTRQDRKSEAYRAAERALGGEPDEDAA